MKNLLLKKVNDISLSNNIIDDVENVTEKSIVNTKKTVLHSANNVPESGSIEYPPFHIGLQVFILGLFSRTTWRQSTMLNIFNEDYVKVTYDHLNKIIISIRDIVMYTKNLVQYPIGCRVIAKFCYLNSSFQENYQIGIIAEFPSRTNKFRKNKK